MSDHVYYSDLSAVSLTVLYRYNPNGPIYRLHTGKVHYQAMIVTEVSSII